MARKQLKNSVITTRSENLQKNDVLGGFPRIKEQIQSFPSFGWTREAIQNAILNHDQGRFQLSEQLYHAMRREPRIYAALRTRVEAHRSNSFLLKCNDRVPATVKKSIQQLEDNFDMVISKQTISEILSRIVMFGFCIARHELVYNESIGQLIPTIVPWSASYCYYNYTERAFHVVADTIGDVAVIGDPWIVFTTGGDRPWLNGAMRSLGFPYWLVSQGFEGWSQFNDDEARAYKHLTVPTMKREQTETDALYKNVSMSRAGDTIITAADTTFSFVSPTGRAGAYKTYQDLATMAYDTISIVLLANNLVQEIRGGSFAAATAANGLAREVSESDTENVERPINQDTLRLWVDINFTPSAYGLATVQSFKPSAELAINNVDNEEIKAKTAQQYSDSFQKFIAAAGPNVLQSLQIDWNDAARKAGVPLLQDRMQKETE